MPESTAASCALANGRLHREGQPESFILLWEPEVDPRVNWVTNGTGRAHFVIIILVLKRQEQNQASCLSLIGLYFNQNIDIFLF